MNIQAMCLQEIVIEARGLGQGYYASISHLGKYCLEYRGVVIYASSRPADVLKEIRRLKARNS